jgi:hypothetical protein
MFFRPTSPSADPAGKAHHRFVVVVPVADRPQHLRACLGSLAELMRRYPYGDGGQVRVLIADDSDDPACIADNRALAAQYSAEGLPCTHFPPDEQAVFVGALGEDRAGLASILGRAPLARFSHKGQGAMRNIAYLKLARMLRGDPDADRTLVWSIDSDQEFKVKVETAQGDAEEFSVDFFHALDEIFRRTDAEVLTGKVVGDPPVSAAVMTNNFLDDVAAFLQDMAACTPDAPCCHHAATTRRQGEAAYHDMADLFGFARADAYRYRCTLDGDHSEADCFAHFAFRLAGFFHGEHPTRVSYYVPGDALASVQPARTVYAGNYVFRATALAGFLPFAHLRLRMSGPTLGRLLRAQLGPHFVSANLPMLHRRTVGGTARAEFRPGIDVAAAAIDMGGELERQFYGDVMLFAVERLTDAGFPPAADTAIADAFDAVRAEMLARYNARHEAIRAKLQGAEEALRNPARWWNRSVRHGDAVAAFAAFFANVARNFAADALACRRINTAASWTRWRGELIEAVARYPDDRDNWRSLLHS